VRAKAKTTVKKDKVKTLCFKIAEEYRVMNRLYQGKKFVDLARFLESLAAVIVTPDYKKLRGGASAYFWKRSYDQGAKLEFKTANIFFGSAIGVSGVGANRFDSVAFITHEVHLIKKMSAARINCTAYMETSEKHRTDCPWY
jgi:hypothetical protein